MTASNTEPTGWANTQNHSFCAPTADRTRGIVPVQTRGYRAPYPSHNPPADSRTKLAQLGSLPAHGRSGSSRSNPARALSGGPYQSDKRLGRVTSLESRTDPLASGRSPTVSAFARLAAQQERTARSGQRTGMIAVGLTIASAVVVGPGPGAQDRCQVDGGVQGVGVVLAQDPAAAVQGVLGQVTRGRNLAQGAQGGSEVISARQGGGVVLPQDPVAAVQGVLVQVVVARTWPRARRSAARFSAVVRVAGWSRPRTRRRRSRTSWCRSSAACSSPRARRSLPRLFAQASVLAGWSSPRDPAQPVEGVLVQVAELPVALAQGAQVGGGQVTARSARCRGGPGPGTRRRRSRLSWSRSRAARTSPRKGSGCSRRSLAVVKVLRDGPGPRCGGGGPRVSWSRSRACAQRPSRRQRPAEVVSRSPGCARDPAPSRSRHCWRRWLARSKAVRVSPRASR